MSDLVDYLREKLAAPDGPRLVDPPGMIAIGDVEVLLWPGEWLCRVCREIGPHTPSGSAAWDHLRTHVPPRRKRWWRR